MMGFSEIMICKHSTAGRFHEQEVFIFTVAHQSSYFGIFVVSLLLLLEQEVLPEEDYYRRVSEMKSTT